MISGKAAQIADICRRYHVSRLEVFGSAARGEDFDPGRSDVDFLVEFDSGPTLNRFDAYFGLQRALVDLLGRHVDLVTLSSVTNPFVRASIDEHREMLHGA